jgi:SsrA-binding protein
MSAKTIEINNRKASHEYTILETLEAGIQLTGTEVKSLRNGRANLQDSFARVEKGQLLIYHFHISPYEKGNRENVEEKRPRKLLVHKEQIRKLYEHTAQQGQTLVALKGYFNNRNIFKILIGIAKGKQAHDKRQDIKKRDTEREIRQAMKHKHR